MERLLITTCIAAWVLCTASAFVRPATTIRSEIHAVARRQQTEVHLFPVDALHLHFLPTTSTGQEVEIAVETAAESISNTHVVIAENADLRASYNSPGGWIFLAYIGFSVLAGLSELSSRFQKWRESREE